MAAQRDRRAGSPAFLWITLILLLSGLLRLDTAAADVRFHSDEALYSTYARDAVTHGRWMLDGPLDKPPLSIYVNALAMHFFAARITSQDVIDVPPRTGEIAAKMPNVYAGLLLVALTYTLVRALYPTTTYRTTTALIAALLAGVSPYNVAYSGSAFTDMLMLCLMVASLLMVTRQHSGIAGLLLGLSIAAKPQGVLYLPLAIGLPWLLQQRSIWQDAMRLLVGILLIMAALFLWDTARPETSFWTLGAVNISQDRLIAPTGTWGARLSDWLAHGETLLGPAWITALMLLLGTGVTIWRRQPFDAWLFINAVGLFVLHWIGAFFTFDRYLLIFTPLVGMLAARGAAALWANRASKMPAAIVLSALLLLALLSGSAEHNPRRDVFRSTSPDGYFEAAAWLNDRPLGTIIYDHWLSWEMGYYMGAWTDKRRVYYPEPAQLATDALKNPDPAPRYLLAPLTQRDAVDSWLSALRGKGFDVSLAYHADGFLVYRVVPPWATN